MVGLWLADAAWSWTSPHSYGARPRWITGSITAFFAFMAINGAVVFETGPVRWIGVAVLLVMAVLATRRLAAVDDGGK